MARPTDYDPSYCDAVIEHMAAGASLASFAAHIEVARSTINKWADTHPAFSEAVSIAKAKCAAWWEAAGRKIVLEGGTAPQATMITLGLKNMAADDWREKQHVEHSGSVEQRVAPRKMTDEELEAEVARLRG